MAYLQLKWVKPFLKESLGTFLVKTNSHVLEYLYKLGPIGVHSTHFLILAKVSFKVREVRLGRQSRSHHSLTM